MLLRFSSALTPAKIRLVIEKSRGAAAPSSLSVFGK
jgi:hypothetical protein